MQTQVLGIRQIITISKATNDCVVPHTFPWLPPLRLCDESEAKSLIHATSRKISLRDLTYSIVIENKYTVL